jgi:AcrR family transcriptional regulator
MSPDGSSGAKPGLRERKKRKTREAIQREAMRLFLKNGYEETTIEQIAAAVEISPSTFFNYFPSKEDVVLYDAYDPMIVTLLAMRPADEPLSQSIRSVLTAIGTAMEKDRDVVYARSRLVVEEPELRARGWEEMEKAQAFLSAMVAARTGRDPEDFEIRVVMMSLVGAMMEATREWVRNHGKEDLSGLLSRAYDMVDGGTRLDALASGKALRPPAST